MLEATDALTEKERADGCRPGGWQQTAYLRQSNRIFLPVDQRDQWGHKTAIRFVVVLDAGTGKRIERFALKHRIDLINVRQGAAPLLYPISSGDRTLHVHDVATGKEQRIVGDLGRGPSDHHDP